MDTKEEECGALGHRWSMVRKGLREGIRPISVQVGSVRFGEAAGRDVCSGFEYHSADGVPVRVGRTRNQVLAAVTNVDAGTDIGASIKYRSMERKCQQVFGRGVTATTRSVDKCEVSHPHDPSVSARAAQTQ